MDRKLKREGESKMVKQERKDKKGQREIECGERGRECLK